MSDCTVLTILFAFMPLVAPFRAYMVSQVNCPFELKFKQLVFHQLLELGLGIVDEPCFACLNDVCKFLREVTSIDLCTYHQKMNNSDEMSMIARRISLLSTPYIQPP